MFDFTFFERALLELRAYDYSAGHLEMINLELARLVKRYPGDNLPLLKSGPTGHWNCPSLLVAHAFVRAETGAKIIEAEFDIRLPEDFIEFYNQWNEGLLLVRNPMRILSPKDIIADVRDLRKLESTPSQTPHHVFRFAQLNYDFHFILRLSPVSSEWEVNLLSSSEFTIEQILASDYKVRATDNTFIQWLQRMLATDGAPLHPACPDDENDFFNERVL